MNAQRHTNETNETMTTHNAQMTNMNTNETMIMIDETINTNATRNDNELMMNATKRRIATTRNVFVNDLV